MKKEEIILWMISVVIMFSVFMYIITQLIGQSSIVTDRFCKEYPNETLYWCGSLEVKCKERMGTSCDCLPFVSCIKNKYNSSEMLEILINKVKSK